MSARAMSLAFIAESQPGMLLSDVRKVLIANSSFENLYGTTSGGAITMSEV